MVVKRKQTSTSSSVFHTYGIVCICCVCSAQLSGQPVHHCDTTVTKHLVCFAEVSAADNNSNLIEPAAEVKPKLLCNSDTWKDR